MSGGDSTNTPIRFAAEGLLLVVCRSDSLDGITVDVSGLTEEGKISYLSAELKGPGLRLNGRDLALSFCTLLKLSHLLTLNGWRRNFLAENNVPNFADCQ